MKIVSLNQLGNILSRFGSIPVTCPHCSKHMSFKTYHLRHIKKRHNIDTTKVCPFCITFTWPKSKKARPEHVLHRLECAKTFLKRQSDTSEWINKQKDNNVCLKCARFDSRKLQTPRRDNLPLVYQSVLENDSFFDNVTNVVECSEESGLGRIAPAALAAFKDFSFYHVPVVDFDAFVDYFRLAYSDGLLTLLPYWCLCGPNNIRHVIVVCEKKFTMIWPNCQHIRSPYELIAYIDGFSRPDGACGDLLHHWINRRVYPHAVIGMHALIPQGLQTLVASKCLDMNVTFWHDRVIRDINGGWIISVKDTGVVPVWNCVLPVRWDLEPTTAEEGEVYVPGLKCWFKSNPDRVFDKDWYLYQKRMGNVLMESICDEHYVFSDVENRKMDEMMKLKMDWNVDLLQVLAQYESERDRYRSKYEALLCENSSLEKQLVEKIQG